MNRSMVGLAVGFSLLLVPACEDTRDRADAGPVVPSDAGGGGGGGTDAGGGISLMDSGGGPGDLPGESTGLGALASSCVDFCRDLFAGCSRVELCFFDAGGGCTPQELTASSCASQCANADATRAALTAAGCDDEYGAFETCVASRVAGGDCQIYNEDCGIEWGVYAGCAGL